MARAGGHRSAALVAVAPAGAMRWPPGALLWFFRLQLLDEILAIGVWLGVVPLAVGALRVLVRGTGPDVSGTMGLLVAFVTIHGFLLVARMPVLLDLMLSCTRLVENPGLAQHAFHLHARVLLQSLPMRVNQILSVHLLLWYLVGMIILCSEHGGYNLCHMCGFEYHSCRSLTAGQLVCIQVVFIDGIALLVLGIFLGGSTIVQWFESEPLPMDGVKRAGDVNKVTDYPCYPHSLEDGQVMTCIICVDDIGAGDMVRILPCGHRYHQACIDTWLKRSLTCPLRCRIKPNKVVPM